MKARLHACWLACDDLGLKLWLWWHLKDLLVVSDSEDVSLLNHPLLLGLFNFPLFLRHYDEVALAVDLNHAVS